MPRWSIRGLLLLAGAALPSTGNVVGQEKGQPLLWTPRPLMSGEVPLPARVARADVVVRGRVVRLEPKDVEALLAADQPYKLDYRIAVVKIDEVIHGPKDLKELRLGFISPKQDRKLDKAGKVLPALAGPQFRAVQVGNDGLFFLRKHQQRDFFVQFTLIGGFLGSNAADFDKHLKTVRLLAKMLDRPLDALKADSATNRYLAAVMLIGRYRQSGTRAEAIDAEESSLLLKALAEADWKDVNEALTSMVYPPHPYRVFLRLGVTRADGYDPPTGAPNFRATLDYTQRWLVDNQKKYRIQRLTSVK